MVNTIGAETKYPHKTQKKILGRQESIFGPLACLKDMSPFQVMRFYHIFNKSSSQIDWVCTNHNIRKTLSLYPFNNFINPNSDILVSAASGPSSMFAHIDHFWAKIDQIQTFLYFFQYFSNSIHLKSIQNHLRTDMNRFGEKN